MASARAWEAPAGGSDDEDEVFVDDGPVDARYDAIEEAQVDDDRGHMPPAVTQPAPPALRLPTAPHRQRFLPSEQPQMNTDLVPTSAVGEAYAHIFPYESFNLMQSECFDMLFNSEVNVVVTAPTGSGKTVLFELALCRMLARANERAQGSQKALYLAPLKALVGQRFADWKDKFGNLGITCCEVSGDTDDFSDVMRADIIVATAEKWDSITRKLSKQTLMSHIALVLIDEVHTLNEDRGAVLEAVVSRMKLQQHVTRRYLAISATAPNLEDIGEWLQAPPSAVLRFAASYRPVQLTQTVLSFPSSKNGFLFDRNLNWRLPEVVLRYDEGKPSLVFCATRKECVNAATALVRGAAGPRVGRQPFVRGDQARALLIPASRKAVDKSLQEMILNGVGVYHAGLDFSDRRLVEELFIAQALSVVCTTSSLAQGVNLPAHLVVVKSTQFYKPGAGYQELSDLAVLQMIGRAGRPQFDDSGAAVIMTSVEQREKWERLLGGRELIESNLSNPIVEHITAEICRGTISQERDVLHWLQSTFLYVRMRRDPGKYGLPAGKAFDEEVRRLCADYIAALLEAGMISRTNDALHAEPMGHCMTKYYLRFDTFKQFRNVTTESTLLDLIKIVANAAEFNSIVLRRSEKAHLNAANKHQGMRFPQKGNVKDVPSKVAVLLQSALCGISVKDFSLQQDTNVIFAAGVRISRALVEYLLWKQVAEAPLLAGLDLLRIMVNRIWENSPHLARQVDKIGPVMSSALVTAGITSLDRLETSDPRVIEGLVNRHAPFGTEVLNHVRRIPKFAITVSDNRFTVTVSLRRQTPEPPAKSYRYSVLVVADSDGRLLRTQRVQNAQEQQEVQFTVPPRDLPSAELSVHLVGEDVFGRDQHVRHRLSAPVPPRPKADQPPRKRPLDARSDAADKPAAAAPAPAPAPPVPAAMPSAALKDVGRYDAAVNAAVKRLRPAPHAQPPPAPPPARPAPSLPPPGPSAEPPSASATTKVPPRLPPSAPRPAPTPSRVSQPTAAAAAPPPPRPATSPRPTRLSAPHTSRPPVVSAATPSSSAAAAAAGVGSNGRPLVDLSAVFADLF